MARIGESMIEAKNSGDRARYFLLPAPLVVAGDPQKFLENADARACDLIKFKFQNYCL